MHIRERCRAFVVQHCVSYDASHDISHIDRVVTNALKILSLSDDATKAVIRPEILISIASLHDTFDHKYLTTHAAESKARSEVIQFLGSECGFNFNIIETVIAVIDNMGFTSEVSGKADKHLPIRTLQYLEIVQDADRLDAIGAVGVARCLAFTGAFGRPIMSESGVEELEQRKKFAQGQLIAVARKGGSAICHFYDKLVFLKDMLKTPAGKILGEKRHKFILSFLDEFFDEVA